MTNLSTDRLYAQNYFNFIDNQVSDQSNSSNILQFPKNEIPEPAEQRELLASFDFTKGQSLNINGLLELQTKSLSQCVPLIRAGFNFLCYGFGSKIDLINKNIPTLFDDFNIFNLSPLSDVAASLGPISLFNSLLCSIYQNCCRFTKGSNTKMNPENLMFMSGGTANKSSLIAKTEILCKILLSDPTSVVPILVVIHQLDSPAIRSPVVMECLLKLSLCKNVSVIASIENPGIVNIFSKSQFEQFNWLWMDCTTMSPYTEELNRFTLDACQASSSRNNPRAAVIVLQSLTSNSRSIFKLLATFQLSTPEAEVACFLDSLEDEDDSNGSTRDQSSSFSSVSTFNGLSYHALLQKCLENFVVSAEANFRTQLTEFTDHDLFKSLEGTDGSTHFFIPFYHPELKQIFQDGC